MKFIESFMTFEFDAEKTCRIEQIQQAGNHSHVLVCECVTFAYDRLQDALCLALTPLLHAWNILPHDVKVINEEIATNLHLVIDSYPVEERIRLSKDKMHPRKVQRIGEAWLRERNPDVIE